MTRIERSQERRYLQTFIKIEIPSWTDLEGEIQVPWMSKERLVNEYTTLQYIGEKTTIPVPKPLHLGYIDGGFAMITDWVDGVPFDELHPQIRDASYLDEYVQTVVLPQLRALTSHTFGTMEGVVLPPRRVFDNHPQGTWCPRTSEKEEYHFTHNDLSQHNFLCNRETGKVEAIIDWEFAGFYPSFFEAPLWQAPYREIEDDPEEIIKLLDFLKPITQVSQKSLSTESSTLSSNDCAVHDGSLLGREQSPTSTFPE